MFESQKVELSPKQREKLSSQVKNCLFFRADDSDSANVLNQGIIRYGKAYAKGATNIQLPEEIDIELIKLGDLFDKAIDLVLDKSVNACIYAFETLPKDYMDCLIHFAKLNVDAFDDDPVLVLSYSDYDIDDVSKEIADSISDDFKKLSIDCSDLHFKQKETFPNISIGGAYNSQSRTLKLFPLATLLSAGRKSVEPLVTFNPNISDKELKEKVLMCRSDFIAGIVLENFIHELSHLTFKCSTEEAIIEDLAGKELNKLKNKLGVSSQAAKSMVETAAALGMGQSMPKLLLALEEGSSIYDLVNHCARFKLGLLYLLSSPGDIQIVRTLFIAPIRKAIIKSQHMKFDYQKNKIDLDLSFVSVDATGQVHIDRDTLLDLQYAWELDYVKDQALLGDLRSGFFKLTFRSEVVTTSDLEKTLEKRRSRSNYAKTKYQFIDRIDLADDDLLFAFEGNANILSIPFLEDPLDFLLQLVNRQELMSSRNAGIGESAGLYMMFDEEEMRIKLVYSPDAEVFFEITTGEAWFILSL